MTERESELDRLLAENDAVVGERIDPDFEPSPDETAMESGATYDPDLEAARAQVSGHDPDALTTEELRPEDEMIEYEPPDRPTPETASGHTVEDELVGETLDERLAQEEPDEPV
jgi:hypothetical protein